MKVVVVGAGAWGLPAAAQLALRGHEVTLLDRHGVGNLLSSSSGPSRIWRIADPDPVRLRLAVRSVEAMRRLERRSGTTVFHRRGILWRDPTTIAPLHAELAREGVEHELVDAADVGRYFRGLRPDGRDALWQPEAGVLLAAASLAAQKALFDAAGGVSVFGAEVVAVAERGGGASVTLVDGREFRADAAVVAAGPTAEPLLRGLGIDVTLTPRLEQVVHFGDPDDLGATDDLPSFFDGPQDGDAGIYAMATPGRGYKIGLDAAVGEYARAGDDRTPDPERTALLLERVRRDLDSVAPRVLDAQVCTWTASPDGAFIVDRLPGGIVVAAGDSGKGFKYSALMGEILADLAEGAEPDADVRSLGSDRAGLRDAAGPAADHA